MSKKVYLKCSKVDEDGEHNIIEIPERIFEIDGYSIADRMLEGLPFHIHFAEDGKVTKVEVPKEGKTFFENFNQEKFLKMAKEYAERTLKTGDEVDIPSFLKDKYFVEGRNCSFIEVVDGEEDTSKSEPIIIKALKIK